MMLVEGWQTLENQITTSPIPSPPLLKKWNLCHRDEMTYLKVTSFYHDQVSKKHSSEETTNCFKQPKLLTPSNDTQIQEWIRYETFIGTWMDK